MYPFVRLIKELVKVRNAPPLDFHDTHVTHHRVWPFDIDQFMELNNGRTLTMFDLGRFSMGVRVGLLKALRQERWALAVAGAVIRYRRRLKPFERYEIRTRGLGWDDRFFYIEQQMWKMNGQCANQIVLRTAVTDKNGIVPPDVVRKAIGADTENGDLPDWVKQWLKAEDERPWPPT